MNTGGQFQDWSKLLHFMQYLSTMLVISHHPYKGKYVLCPNFYLVTKMLTFQTDVEVTV
jgi:hypothetical protein